MKFKIKKKEIKEYKNDDKLKYLVLNIKIK